MDFIHFLSSHMLDPNTGGKRLYKSVVAQAVHADKLGYRGVGIPEHHLLNVLLIPSPLQMAVKVAAHTEHVLLVTSVCQLRCATCGSSPKWCRPRRCATGG